MSSKQKQAPGHYDQSAGSSKRKRCRPGKSDQLMPGHAIANTMAAQGYGYQSSLLETSPSTALTLAPPVASTSRRHEDCAVLQALPTTEFSSVHGIFASGAPIASVFSRNAAYNDLASSRASYGNNASNMLIGHCGATNAKNVNQDMDVLIGKHVDVFIDGPFDCGHRITVKVRDGKLVLKGLLFDPYQAAPLTRENDIAPLVPMVTRHDFPTTVIETGAKPAVLVMQKPFNPVPIKSVQPLQRIPYFPAGKLPETSHVRRKLPPVRAVLTERPTTAESDMDTKIMQHKSENARIDANSLVYPSARPLLHGPLTEEAAANASSGADEASQQFQISSSAEKSTDEIDKEPTNSGVVPLEQTELPSGQTQDTKSSHPH